MEHDLDTRLFDRRPDGMFPTDTGEIYARRVARMLDYLKAGAAQAMRGAARPDRPRRGGFHRQFTAVQLRTLIAVTRAASFSHAARLLGVSQPAVQRAARDLESLCGLPLFEPIRRGIAPTPAAEALARNAQLAAAEYRQGLYEISEYLGRDSTRIAVGSMPLSRTSLLPAAIDALLTGTSAGVQVQCVDGPYETLLRDLRHGELDVLVGALRDPPPAEDVAQEPLFSDALSVVTAAGHPLAAQSDVSLHDTLAHPWIAPPKTTPSGRYLAETLGIPDLPESPVRIVSSSLAMTRGLMMRGDYVTVMSRRQFEVEEQQGLLTALPIPLPGSNRDIGLTVRADWQATPTQTRFLDLLRDAAAAPQL